MFASNLINEALKLNTNATGATASPKYNAELQKDFDRRNIEEADLSPYTFYEPDLLEANTCNELMDMVFHGDVRYLHITLYTFESLRA